MASLDPSPIQNPFLLASPSAWLGRDPFAELRTEMNRLFESTLRSFGSLSPFAVAAFATPRLDMHENEEDLSVVVDLPGVSPSAVDLRLEGKTLTISAESRRDAGDRSQTPITEHSYHLMERNHGRLRRTVQLPFTPDPDQVRAEFKDGVLTITMPRQARGEESRRIEVQPAAETATASLADDGVDLADDSIESSDASIANGEPWQAPKERPVDEPTTPEQSTPDDLLLDDATPLDDEPPREQDTPFSPS